MPAAIAEYLVTTYGISEAAAECIVAVPGTPAAARPDAATSTAGPAEMTAAAPAAEALAIAASS